MSKQKPRGKPFEKGNSAARGQGRPKTTPEEKKLARLTRTRFNAIVRKYFHLNKNQLKEIASNPETPAIDLMVISVMNKAIVSGDEKKMNWFLEQLFGKLKEKSEVKVSGNIETTGVDLSTLTDEQLRVMEEIALKNEKKD